MALSLFVNCYAYSVVNTTIPLFVFFHLILRIDNAPISRYTDNEIYVDFKVYQSTSYFLEILGLKRGF